MTGLAVQLFKITQEYHCLIGLIEAVKRKKYWIKEASQVMQELNFEDDYFDIKCYISKRIQKNDIFFIIAEARLDFSPAEYSCQSTVNLHSCGKVFLML